MLMLPPGIKIYVSSKPLDMRKSFNGMTALIQTEMKSEPMSGSLYVFSNKRGDKLKILYWDRNGFAMWYKRLEKGLFRLPRINSKSYKISSQELSMILEGLDLSHNQRLMAV